MNIVALLASPRRGGNSDTIARRFLETAEELGAQTRAFILNELDYRGCQACMACKGGHEKCVLDDDMDDVLEAVRETDVLVLAFPVYFGEVPAQLKGFIDRTYSYMLPDFATNPHPSRLAPGKTLVFIQVQANGDESRFGDIYPRYEYFFNRNGFADNYLIRFCGLLKTHEAAARADILDLAEETARKIMS